MRSPFLWIGFTLAAFLIVASLGTKAQDRLPIGPGSSTNAIVPKQSAAPRVQLVSEAAHAKYMDRLPATRDPFFESLRTKGLTFYDKASMPAAFQIDHSMFSVDFNPVGRNRDRIGHANGEFPWRVTAGLDFCNNADVDHFVYFPPATAIQVGNRFVPRTGRYLVTWRYPTGTVFGENLLVKAPDGSAHSFSIRLRERTDTGWQVHVLAPFVTPESLASRLEEIQEERAARASASARTQLVSFLGSPVGEMKRLQNQSGITLFDRRAIMEYLPETDHDTVRELLRTPFESVTRPEAWRKTDGGAASFAPSTKAAFHIVPRDYGGAFLPVSTKDCMSCHNTVGLHVTAFGQPQRQWLGHVRGGDNIFSFHLFDPACISRDGRQMPIRYRQELLKAGLLKAAGAKGASNSNDNGTMQKQAPRPVTSPKQSGPARAMTAMLEE